jgi:hypothetical protein
MVGVAGFEPTTFCTPCILWKIYLSFLFNKLYNIRATCQLHVHTLRINEIHVDFGKVAALFSARDTARANYLKQSRFRPLCIAEKRLIQRIIGVASTVPLGTVAGMLQSAGYKSAIDVKTGQANRALRI